MIDAGRMFAGGRAAIALLALLAGCAAHAVDVRSVLGAWEVSDIHCPACKKPGRDAIGTPLDLTASSASSPLIGGACPDRVDYRDGDTPAAARRTWIGKLDPAWLDPASRTAPIVVVTCGGVDFMVLVVLPHDHVALIGDGDITYRFARGRKH